MPTVFFLLAITYIQQGETKNFCILVISSNPNFISEILKVVGPLGRMLDFFIPLGFEIQSTSDHKTSKTKFRSGRALK